MTAALEILQGDVRERLARQEPRSENANPSKGEQNK